MSEIEELSLRLLSSVQFRTLLRQEVRECSRELGQESASEEEQRRMPELVHEINCYLTEITQMALQEENSHNYITFMNKTQEYYLQLQKKMEARLASTSGEIMAQVEGLERKVRELAKMGRRGWEGNVLKEERRVITQNILQNSKIIYGSKTKSTVNPRSVLQNKTNSFLSEEPADDCFPINQTPSGLQTDFESEIKIMVVGIEDRLENSLKLVRKEQTMLKQLCCELKERVESSTDANFEGVWNVISDLSSRISKLESLQTIISLCNS